MKKIIIASDQMGVSLKQLLIEKLEARGVVVKDAGPHRDDVVVDYPDYIRPAAQAVARGDYDGGIVICGTGLGASIAANKVPGARAALCTDTYTAQKGRAHNDANILALGAWVVTPQRAELILEEWLKTPFDGGRHIPRLQKLDVDFSDTGADDTWLELVSFQFGVALSVNPTSFGPVLFGGRFEEGLKTVSEAGFSRVELSLRHVDDISVERLGVLLERYRLKAAAFATGQGCIMDELCLSAADTKLRKAAVERLKGIIDMAVQFSTVVVLGGVRGKLVGGEAARNRQYETTVEAIGECLEYAEDQGVIVVLEPINRYETNLVNTIAEGIELLEKTAAGSGMLLPDTFHMNIEEVDMLSSLRMAGDKLGYIHFSDSNRLSPGQGHVDFKGVMKTLYEIGYGGCITAEILPLPDEHSAVYRTAQYLSSILGAPIKDVSSREVG